MARPVDSLWTAPEDALLREYYGRVSWSVLQQVLPGRTLVAIKSRAGRLGLRQAKEPAWVPAEDTLLRQLFGRYPPAKIARRLGRSENAIEVRAKRLGLRHRSRRERTPNQVGRMLGLDPKKVKGWIERGWLRARVAPTAAKRIHLVAPEDLVVFLKTHPDQWDARRCPDLHVRLGLTNRRGKAALLDRPLWLRQKLAGDVRRKRRGKPWSRDEDRELARLMRRGLTYVEIGWRLGRTGRAVQKRVRRLGRNLWQSGRQAV